MSKNKLDTSVYVDFSALNEWRNQMDNINSSAMDTLDSFMSTVEDLKDSWAGNSAESFLTSATGVINKAKGYHTEMGNTENFLITVIDTMDKQ
jgi:uncharacterized protein YukE